MLLLLLLFLLFIFFANFHRRWVDPKWYSKPLCGASLIRVPSFRIPRRPYFVAKVTLKSSTWHWTSHTAWRWLPTPSVWLRAKKDSRLTTDSYKELFMIKVSVKRKSSRTRASASPWWLSTCACVPPYQLGTADGQRFRSLYATLWGVSRSPVGTFRF